MAPQPMNSNSLPNTSTGWVYRINTIALISISCAFIGIVCILSSCSTPATEIQATVDHKPSISPTPKPTKTLVPSLTLTPSLTIKPFGTPILGFELYDGDSIFEVIDIPVKIEIALERLPSGLYIIGGEVDLDNNAEEFNYTSIITDQQGLLLEVGEIIDLNSIFFDSRETWVLGGFGSWTTKYYFNLSRDEAFQFPICPLGGTGIPSPTGRRLATICSDGKQDGKIIFEIISLLDGTVMQLEVSSLFVHPYEPSTIDWINDDSFIFSIESNEKTCLISITDLGIRCAPSLAGKPLLSVSPLGTYLLANHSRGYTWIKDIHLIECFHDKTKCDPIVTLEDEYTSSNMMYWSPDETMLAIDFGDHLTSTTAEIGYYDTYTWTYHHIGTFPRTSGFFDWCPDSSCMLIAGEPSYLAYIDGRMSKFTISSEYLIDVIEVP
jgi:hypothetical protein